LRALCSLDAPNPIHKGDADLRKKIALFYVLVTLLCLTAFTFALFHAFGVRVNRSDSLPGILYRIVPIKEGEAVNVGDRVLIDLSKIFVQSNPVINQGVERGYVTREANQPMLKRVAGVPGDAVVIKDGFLSVNGETTKMTIASQDSHGEKLSSYPTPITLPPGWYWLTSDPERGFDSRYFGPLPGDAFTHKAFPLF
jgi:conjugative transfer signal peptidase TraF